jgi:hypothetical protein
MIVCATTCVNMRTKEASEGIYARNQVCSGLHGPLTAPRFLATAPCFTQIAPLPYLTARSSLGICCANYVPCTPGVANSVPYARSKHGAVAQGFLTEIAPLTFSTPQQKEAEEGECGKKNYINTLSAGVLFLQGFLVRLDAVSTIPRLFARNCTTLSAKSYDRSGARSKTVVKDQLIETDQLKMDAYSGVGAGMQPYSISSPDSRTATPLNSRETRRRKMPSLGDSSHLW